MKVIIRIALLAGLLVAIGLAGCQKAPAAASQPAAAAAPAAGGARTVSAAGVTMEYNVVGSNIEITLRAQTAGWVAVGFDPQTLMKGANFIMGYVKDGKAVVADHFGNQLTGHAADETLGGKDNIANASGKEENGTTEIRFTIPLDSGDQYDKPLGKGKHVVLLAHGDGDDFVTQHKPNARGKVTIEL
jgi:hypothetical protein